MRPLIEKLLCVVLLGACFPAARAFTPAGDVTTAPDNAFETPQLGYNPNNALPFIDLPGPNNTFRVLFQTSSLLNTGPRNITEEYRINAPVWYYTYDATFIDYFQTNGTMAGDQAFAIINNSFTYTNSFATNRIGVDGFSDSLVEFPDYSEHINTTALGLSLTDVKSVFLSMMMPQIGLENPDRYVWTLRNVNPTGAGFITGGHCPEDAYFEVMQRNYGIYPSNVLPIPSSYINDELYTYLIFYWPNCTPPAGAGPDLYRTIPYAVSSPLGTGFPLGNTAVASGGLFPGGFYTGMTRDDMAGLRYLLTTNNVNFESPAPGALLQATNLAPIIVLVSSNLNTLLTTAQVTDPALLPGLFPGVVVANSSNFWASVLVTNFVSYVTNFIGAPYNYGTKLVTVPVVNPAFQQFFVTTYANVVTNGNLTNTPNIIVSPGIKLNYYTTNIVTTLTVSLGAQIGAPYPPPPQTNVTTSTKTLIQPSGEYLVLPPGACGFKILAMITNPPVYTTNLISSAVNSNGFVDTVSTVTAFTPHQFLVQPIDCTSTTPNPGLYQGIGKVKFVRADFDSLLGQTFRPVTNNYTMVLLTNSQLVTQQFQRVVTVPDILISAADITPNYPFFNATEESSPTFVHDPGYAGSAGPGTITPPTGGSVGFTFNKVGDIFLNGSLTALGYDTNAFFPLNQTVQSQFGVIWASFDATTNPPFVYGMDLQNLGNQAIIQITPPPPFLPDGTNGMAYPTTPFSATGGAFSLPFTWTATGLPQGLSFISNPDSTATLSPGPDTPVQSGTFDITVQMTDSLGRPVTWNYTITIH